MQGTAGKVLGGHVWRTAGNVLGACIGTAGNVLGHAGNSWKRSWGMQGTAGNVLGVCIGNSWKRSGACRGTAGNILGACREQLESFWGHV